MGDGPLCEQRSNSTVRTGGKELVEKSPYKVAWEGIEESGIDTRVSIWAIQPIRTMWYRNEIMGRNQGEESIH